MKDKRPDSNYNAWQLRTGIKIEMEHTKSKALAKKIAKDHLDEFPDYYTHLVIMERRLKKEKEVKKMLCRKCDKCKHKHQCNTITCLLTGKHKCHKCPHSATCQHHKDSFGGVF